MGADPITVVVADDHPAFLEGLRRFLGRDPQIDIVATAADGDDAIALAGKLEPTGVVRAIKLRGTGGIEATRAIKAARPEVSVLMLTMFDDAESVFAALAAGALGYICKDADAPDVRRAVHAVARGESVFAAGIVSHIANHFSRDW